MEQRFAPLRSICPDSWASIHNGLHAKDRVYHQVFCQVVSKETSFRQSLPAI